MNRSKTTLEFQFVNERARRSSTETGLLLPAIAPGPILLLIVSCLCAFVPCGFAIGQVGYVETSSRPGDFSVVDGKVAARVYVDPGDHAGVIRAVDDLRSDITRVTSRTPTIAHEEKGLGTNLIIVGTLGRNRLVDRLIRDGKLDVSAIAGQWESFLIQVVPAPLPGVANALVIVGSDKRGTIYGVYDLSEQIGVSPWYWWADVPVAHKDTLFVKAGKYVQGPPAVKYRGIFLNDEAPALTGWVFEKYGNYNHRFYTNVFELLLRLKANYLWPAMWNNCFNEDDPLNPKLADEYGIVMGTSHVEPMLRADKEWNRKGYKASQWNYATHAEALRAFWKEGIERNRNFESLITIGMRGKIDTPMSESANIALLERIVADQRELLAEAMHTNASVVPQVWALYKEVQEYYEKGMRVPDDVTLLWCDDNWGNVRRLPTPEERKRSGGAGVYYHFDYVGGPRNYKWLNTVPITKVWDQMNLACQYGANRIWIANVGDLKPMEFPMEFFLNLAWDPKRWAKEKISEYTRLWAQREFGPKQASAIADLIAKYTKYNGRRKPELLEPNTFSLTECQEADSVLADWKSIAGTAEQIYRSLPGDARDAFYELVLYPVKACAVVSDLYITVGRNRLYARQGRASANDLAAQARALFHQDAELSNEYNHAVAHGKWNHMMDQTHIGYTYWQQPPSNSMPKVTEIDVPAAAELGVAVEGSASAWPGAPGDPSLPQFDVFNRQRRFIDVFNRGKTPFEFSAAAGAPWIRLSATQGTVDKEQRLWVSVDWEIAPKGSTDGFVRITRRGANSITVKVDSFNPKEPAMDTLTGFVEAEGYVSIEAEHYTKKVDAGPVRWEKIDDYGPILSSMTLFPVTADSVTPPQNSPCLEYQMYLFTTGKVEVTSSIAPTLNFVPGRGLRFAVSFDDEAPQILTAVPRDFFVDNGNRDWEASVRDNCRKIKSIHVLEKPGYHTFKVWMVDPAVVLQKIVVDTGGMRASYLGPLESHHGGLKEGAVERDANGSGAFATGHYRNLFVEAGHSPQEVTSRIDAAYQQLFHGDPAAQTVFYFTGTNANGPLAYITDVAHNDVRTEGMSYGMIIAVQLDRKPDFDALWNWAKTYMYNDSPAHPSYRFFSWSLKTNGVPNSELVAPDGEEYFVMALYFAAGRWSNGRGIYNYQAEADRLLTSMRHRVPITGSAIMPPRHQGQVTGGALFNPEHKMVRFSPSSEVPDHTDPSYHLPAFYELWARCGPAADRSFWLEAATVSRDFFQLTTHPVTGLAPNYANFDGTPHAGSRNKGTVDFRFDAWRTAMNWSVDWSWWAKDPRERALSDRLQAFFESKGMTVYGNLFTLDGRQLGSDHSTGLVAMNAVASLAATDPRAQRFVEALWTAAIPEGPGRYYDGLLYLKGLLHCSGEFRIWSPP